MALGNYLTFAVLSIFCAVVFMLDPPATTPGQQTTQTNCSKPCFANKSCDANCTCYASQHGRFFGENCIDHDECLYNKLDVCHNRGYCTNTWGSYRCDCLAGWTGPHCTKKDPNFTTRPCLPGYAGSDCRTLAACVHGNGRNISGNLTCFCHEGWTHTGGNRSSEPCSTDIDECQSPEIYCINGKCTNFINGSYNCNCTLPYFGSTCNYFNALSSTSLSSTATSSPAGGSGTNVPLAVGASVGAVTLTGVVTVSLVCIYRKLKHRKIAPKEADTEQAEAESSGGTTLVISET